MTTPLTAPSAGRPKSGVPAYDPGLQVNEDECLCLHRNENLFVTDEWTVGAARDLAAESAIATYPDPTASELREAIARMYGVGPENVFVGNGSDEVLSDLFGLLRHSYDAIGLFDVGFRIYLLLAHRFGFRVDRLPGNTFETGRVAADGWSGLAVVDSPNAITGASLSAGDLAGLASDSRSFLIWDNVYGEYAGEEVPRAIRSNLVVVRSFSKFFALAGTRVGYCIAHEDIVRELLVRKDAFNVNGFGQVMALEALRRRPYFDGLASQMLACRRELIARLTRLEFKLHPSTANFVLATHPERPADELELRLLARGIAVRRFSGEPTADFLRITVPPMPILNELTDALAELIEGGGPVAQHAARANRNKGM